MQNFDLSLKYLQSSCRDWKSEYFQIRSRIPWGRLHIAEICDLCSSPNIIPQIQQRKVRWAGHVPRMGNRRDVYGYLVGTSEGNRPLGILRRGLENTVKMGLQDASWGGMDWIDVAQDKDSWGCMDWIDVAQDKESWGGMDWIDVAQYKESRGGMDGIDVAQDKDSWGGMDWIDVA